MRLMTLPDIPDGFFFEGLDSSLKGLLLGIRIYNTNHCFTQVYWLPKNRPRSIRLPLNFLFLLLLI